MDETYLVQCRKCLRELTQAVAQALLVGEHTGRWSDVVDEVGPLDQLHREKRLLAIVNELTQCHEVRVAEVLERSKLVLEARLRLARDVAQCLDGNARAAI